LRASSHYLQVSMGVALAVPNIVPVILSSANYDVWLDHCIQDTERLQPLLRPYPAEAMEAYSVGTRVNNPANDVPECTDPLKSR
jgi:putative SOS response-associated peptidase YedK